jgi:hypothetical protein
MQMTNGQLADLIDALKLASEFLHLIIDGTLLPDPKDDEPDDADRRAEWTLQMKRYRALRRLLLTEERRAM